MAAVQLQAAHDAQACYRPVRARAGVGLVPTRDAHADGRKAIQVLVMCHSHRDAERDEITKPAANRALGRPLIATAARRRYGPRR